MSSFSRKPRLADFFILLPWSRRSGRKAGKAMEVRCSILRERPKPISFATFSPSDRQRNVIAAWLSLSLPRAFPFSGWSARGRRLACRRVDRFFSSFFLARYCAILLYARKKEEPAKQRTQPHVLKRVSGMCGPLPLGPVRLVDDTHKMTGMGEHQKPGRYPKTLQDAQAFLPDVFFPPTNDEKALFSRRRFFFLQLETSSSGPSRLPDHQDTRTR